ncbi:MAG TPA: GNAT family N-acetyltransferase [Gaiellaceae bacterium]|nr:GNAT family N-acetyltransferase [Gaiellaceae bacterium]
MTTASEYLQAYDLQLRTDAETPSAIAVTQLGPLRLVTFAGGRGFITYQDLGDANAARISALVEGALEHYRGDPAITRVEWKTRGHDLAPGLHDALVRNGFTPEDEESIMIGEAELLAVDIALPEGVVLRQVSSPADVRAMCEMQGDAFGDSSADAETDALLHRLSLGDGMQLWIAEAAGQIVSAGRLEPVRNSEFAGIWGGATRPEWRRRGIYRALTAARARSALELGKRLIHSDSTEYSRPILERAGLVKVSTTTPYVWLAGHT